MPFGLTNAPAVFQNLINDVLRDMLNRLLFVYLDGILVFSKNLHKHHQHLRQVLERLLQNRLVANAEKCEFHVKTTAFLEYIISPGRFLPRSQQSKNGLSLRTANNYDSWICELL